MEGRFDEKDMMILDVLRKHGDYTVRQIARNTLLAPTTIHSRLRKLKASGVIRGYTIDVDEKKLGRKLGAYILISADLKMLKERHKSQYTLAEEIRKLHGVEAVDIVTGVTDLIAKIRVTDIEEMDRLLLSKLQLLEGVSKTQTMIIMH
jgi:DNA-binding Lrp family transcriptional regulator